MAIPPQMILSLAEMFKDKKKKDDEIGRNLIDKTKNTVTQGAGIFGNLLQATSSLPGQEPNVSQSAFGGALSGLSSGMAFGPLGALFGAAIGGIGGYASGSKNLEEYLTGLNEEQKMNLMSKTVEPTMYDEGGEVKDAGVQTEVGEIILLPSTLELVRSAAKKDHEDMDSSHISDFLPEGSEVFSTKLKFDPTKIKEKVVGQGYGHYTEEKTYAPEEMEIEDKFGNKEVSFAEAAEILKKKISVVGNSSKDIFDKITDAENKETRSMYLNVLIEEQDKERYKDVAPAIESVQMFRLGGRVKKYPEGGPVGAGVSDKYYENVLKKLNELRGKNEESFARGKTELSDLTRRMRGSIMAQAGVETLFTALQNPNVRPVIQDNTFINDAYQQMPLSFIESQVAPIRGSANSLAQSLLASGVDPKDVPSMIAGTQGRALDAESRMRSQFAMDRVNTDRGRYAALRENLVGNRANIVGAENLTNDNYNKKFSEFGRVIANAIGDNRMVTAGDFTGRRNLEKSYNDNDISLFRTEAEISGNKAKFDDMMSRINERLDRLDLERIKLGRSFDERSGLYDTPLLSSIAPAPVSPQTPPVRITPNGVEPVPQPIGVLPRRPIAPIENNRRPQLPMSGSVGAFDALSLLPRRTIKAESLFPQDPLESLLSIMSPNNSKIDWAKEGKPWW